MKIYDNFLEQRDFKNLQYTLHTNDFPWTFSTKTGGPSGSMRTFIDNNGEGCDPFNTQLNHYFADYRTYKYSPYIKVVKPILDKYKFTAIARIKANLQLANRDPIVSDYHNDFYHYDNGKEIPEDGLTTLIYYVNTNNGYTEFEDGEKVMSVENRLVEFPNNNPKGMHRGVSQTDTYYRAVINFNIHLSGVHKKWNA